MIHGGFFQEMICPWWIFMNFPYLCCFRGKHLQVFHNPTGQWTIPRLCTAISEKPEGRARWWGPLDWKSKKHLRSTLRFFSVSNKNQPSSWNEMLFFRYSFTMFHSFCVYLTYSFHMLLARWFSWPVFLQTRPGQANHRTGMYSSCHP